MSLEIQYKVKSNNYNLMYLREHSDWYKYLNRDDGSYKRFEEEVKSFYKLRPADKISKVLDTFDVVQTLLSNLK